MGDVLKASLYQDSANAYASVLKARIPSQVGHKLLIHLIEGGANNILYKVRGSNDDVTYYDEVSENALTAGESIPLLVTNPWVWLDVWIMSAAPDTPGSVKAVMVVG